MNGNASRSAAAAVVTLFIVAAGGCMGSNDRSGGVGGPPAAAAVPTTTPTTAPTTTPSATPALLPADSPLEPGRHRMVSLGLVGSAPAFLSITAPSSWNWLGSDWVYKDYGADAGAAFGVWQISNRFNHPCTDHTLLKPAPGPGIDELLTALAGQPGISAGPLTDVTIDGYSGKYVELTVATDIATCPVDNGDAPLSGFWLWASPDGDRRYVQGSDETDRIYAIEVEGNRFTFFADFQGRATAADRAELQAIIDSITIEAPSSPTPSRAPGSS
jgi:hypothetical protein